MELRLLKILNTYYKKSQYTQEELADEMTKYNKENGTSKNKSYSRSMISKQLNGKLRGGFISEADLINYMDVFNLNLVEQKELIGLYPVYKYQFALSPEEQRDIESIVSVFKALKDISMYHSKIIVDNKNPFPDGFLESKNDTNRAIYDEIHREFMKDIPRIDVMLPQDFDGYYYPIKEILAGIPDEKDVRIRQILTFSNSRNKVSESEFDLLAFLQMIYSLIYIRRHSYEFYYSFADGSISNIEGLSWPYFICTSDCVIRISQHGYYSWVSHNPVDVEMYHKMYEIRLKHTKPLVQTYSGIKDYFNEIKSSRLIITAEIIDTLCVMEYLPKDFDISQILKTKAFQNNPDLLSMVQDFIEQISIQFRVDENMFYTRSGIYEFAKTGELKEYPQDIVNLATPENRIKILEELKKRVLVQENSKGPFIIDEHVFPINPEFILGTSERCITSYRMGLENWEFCYIDHPLLVSKFKTFFKYHLPNSDMIYSKEKTLEIIDEAITLAKKQLQFL